MNYVLPNLFNHLEELWKEVGLKEFQEEASEESIKEGWIFGTNGRETVNEKKDMLREWRVVGEDCD